MDLVKQILKEFADSNTEDENLFKPRRLENRLTPSPEKAIELFKKLGEIYDRDEGDLFIEMLLGDETDPYILDEYMYNSLLLIPEIKDNAKYKKALDYIWKNREIAANVLQKISFIFSNIYYSKYHKRNI